ncbi:LPS assembly lipoprotein LptE [Mucisphaera sp.]|uniref:LPS assembly lipoprotein LptE n=1 Tax=Mucisphaera sp. TaxID=2913024 RepID=UPI003D132E51
MLLVLPMLVGCQYSAGEAFDPEVRTIAVATFENRTFLLEIEQEIAAALVAEIQKRTPYRIGPPGTADTIIQGTVVSADRVQLSRVREVGLPQELELRVRVDFEWRDLRDGTERAGIRGLMGVGRQVAAGPAVERLEVARHTAAENLARTMVSEMRADW